jgi:exopolyphosphatase/pppGpp-phosphohydrolase
VAPARRHPLVALSILALALAPASADAAPEVQAAMCAIDMGSNTFRRIVGSFEAGRYEQRKIERRTLGVGDDVTTHGRISDAKLREIEAVLSSFKASCQKEGAPDVVAIGTAAFRDAANGRQVVEMAARLGIAMEIASEDREAQLAYLVGSLGRDGYAVIDNGSRSIELVARDGGAPRHVVFNLGYRVAYEQFFAAADDAKAACAAFRERLKQEAAKASFMNGKKRLVGIEFGEMVEVLFKPVPIEGRVLTLGELQQRLNAIASLPPGEFRRLKQTKDIDRALPRLVAAAFLTEAFGYTELALTERELGTGLIIEAGLKRASTKE